MVKYHIYGIVVTCKNKFQIHQPFFFFFHKHRNKNTLIEKDSVLTIPLLCPKLWFYASNLFLFLYPKLGYCFYFTCTYYTMITHQYFSGQLSLNYEIISHTFYSQVFIPFSPLIYTLFPGLSIVILIPFFSIFYVFDTINAIRE